ncbi:MAG: hypothetical protein IJ165_12680 [Proteobacteria bacterium]|nr:hypothetical protein [Pseudomonadota bacterium]
MYYNIHNGVKEKNIPPIDINNYPAIKTHLDQFWDKISKRDDKGVTPYNLRNCAYLDDFNKQKIVYPEITKYLPFYLDENSFMQNDKTFMITGNHLAYLTVFLNSSLFKYCYSGIFPELQGGTRELRKIFMDNVRVKTVSNDINLHFHNLIRSIKMRELEYIDDLIFDLYDLTPEERNVIREQLEE